MVSPDGIFSFSVGDSADVTFGAPGVYTVFVSIADDDGGSTSDSLTKVVTDDCDCTEGKGFWKHEYSDKGKPHTDEASREAYLDIVNFASGVFDEGVPLTTFAEAHLILSGKGGAPAAPEAPGTVTQEVSTGDKKKDKKDKKDNKGNKDKGSGGGSALDGGSSAGGSSAGGSSAGGSPVPAGPVPAGPVPAGPVPAGPVPAGPVPVGPVPAGPVPAGPVRAGPTTQAASLLYPRCGVRRWPRR